MKRLLALLAFLWAGSALAQNSPTWVPWPNTWVYWDGGTPTQFVGPYSGTPVLGDIIYFNGTNWVSLGKPADGTYSVTFTAGVPSWAAGGSVLFSGIGTGTNTTATMTCGTGCSITTSGSGSNTASAVKASSVTYGGIQNETNGTLLGNFSGSAAAPSEQTNANMASNFGLCGINPASCSGVFEDFYLQTGSGASVACGELYCRGVGTNGGATSPVNTASADANHPGVIEVSTGSTTTGAGLIVSQNHDSSTVDNIVIAGNESVEWMIYVPTASGATNTFRVFAGLCDTVTSNGDCVDGIGIYWDNNADTHWGCETASNSVRTTTLSTTVATAAAWHKLNATVNSNATSVAFTVDGSALSCSPLATNIPTGQTRATGLQASIKATAGCASVSTCLMDVDYVKFVKPVTR